MMTGKIRGVSILALFGALAAMPALAQSAAPSTAQPAPPQAADASQLEEIIVTAQRRQQNLQDVPLAVSSLGAADLQDRQIRDTIDLIQHIPNLIGNNNVGLGSSNTYYIRGIGNTESIATQDVPVGTYVDDVYISRQNANNFGLFDVERIEVLRGPQGTLFGRNTTGGAINVIMKKPSATAGGYLEAGAGRFGETDIRASMDAPLSDKVLTKVSMYRDRSDGYVRQVNTGDKLNGTDSYGVRGAVRLLPTDRVTIDLAGDYVDENEANLINRVDPATGDRIATIGITQGALAKYFTGTKANNEVGNSTKSWSLSSNAAWELDDLTLNSITGFRQTTQRYFIDSNPAAPNPVATGVSPILNYSLHQQWSQEFKANGQALDNRLNYTVGFYYLHENNWTDLGTGVGTASGFTVSGDRTIKNTLDSYATYAQGDYKLTDALTATVGVRLSKEEKQLKVATNAGGKGPLFSTALIEAAGIPTDLENEFVTPRFALSYQIDPSLMVYASATRGEKSGGWNGRALANNLFLAFKPEKVWSEELGMRGDFFDHTLRLNATAFYSEAEDVQISAAYTVNGQRIFTTTNPAGLRNYGGELEAEWVPIRGLTFSGSIGVQHARYIDISSDVQAQLAACQAALASNNSSGISNNCNRGFVDFKGRIARPVRAPDFTGLVTATYQIDTEAGIFRPTVGFDYNNGYAIGNAGNSDSTDGAWTDPQVLWNLNLAYEPAKVPNLTLSVGCKNCTDRTYKVSFLSATSIYLNPPMTWDVRAHYKF
ncbi:iron complex outermembrane receptor protein [Nitrospirillum amazonense]|uniref:Iron complex outermembrane receptor protein n=1 Tax=Nitrospirillum amazonense TaxID=28077 RepID=A0A560FFI4_9PROT|nr:TonB-dependent receptor [Nitrospirillum amazonense]TWB20358.1 iron complex outermembrane receptor protein [Nitrospirillum amazonense]